MKHTGKFSSLLPAVEELYDAEGLPVHIWILTGLQWAISTQPESEGRPSDFIYDGDIVANPAMGRMQ